MKRILTAVIILTIVILSFSWITKNSDERSGRRDEREDRTGAMAALDFWTRARAYPNNDIPADKYYRSYLHTKAIHKDLGKSVNSSVIWNPIGPLNLQGRALSVAINPINPSTIYLGTASGGLWRSNSGGLAGDWQQIITGFPVRGVGAIAINPIDTNIMYIGSGEVYRYQASIGGQVTRTTRGSYGVGILKTTNAGSTWALSLNWTLNQQLGIEKLVLNPHNPNTIYAGTSQGLYKSTNAGATWDSSKAVLLVEDILVNPLDTNLVLISCGDLKSANYGVYRSTNGGGSWNISGFPDFAGKTLLEMYGSNPYTVFASVGVDSVTDHGSLWRSTDFGINWSQVADHNGDNLFQVQGWYSHYVAVHPNDSTQIVQAAVPIYKSTNGGATFFNSPGAYSDNHGFAHHPTNPNILYSACDDGIYRSTDFGSSWTNVGYGLITGQFYNGFSSSWQDSLLAVGQSQDHIPGYRYLGTTMWDHGSAYDESGWTGINPTDDHYVYAVNRFGGTIYRSSDRGSTFPYGVSFDGSGAWNSPFVISTVNPAVIYFGDIHIHKSINLGTSFSTTNSGNPLDGNPALSMAMGTTSQDTVYVGMAPLVTNAHIFRTTNGGTSWTNITSSLPDRYPMDLAVDPHDSKTVYATFGGFGSGHIFKSTDAGGTWTDITGTLPDIPTTAITVDPLNSNIVYAGNDLGVYVSTNAGASWSGFSDGLPDGVIIADLSISPSNRVLRAVTHGNGIYERKMFGGLPANYFDYRVDAITSPAPDQVDSLGSILTPSASFRNLSTAAQIDSFNVEFRILNGATELYAVTKRIPGLGFAENRLVNFGLPFTADSAITYTTQAIVIAGDQDPTNDTLRGLYSTAHDPDIALFAIQKGYCPYTEITGGTAGPSGDDGETIAPLPFRFLYDGHLYDSVQISTNGWMEFGSGPQGSLYGLSTPSQVTPYFVPSLATTSRPTKAIGPWWADLSTNGSAGQITYTTLGGVPNRVFVVQWKNILSNYTPAATTATINFQVRLYETTDLIEIYYGPVVPGASPGSPSSASMGLKDCVGGDYRFYDLYNRGTGTSVSLASALNPLFNWPGPDSCYHILTNPVGVQVSLSTGWNMVSNPTTRSDNYIGGIFPTAGKRAFLFNNGYQVTDSIYPGNGYWIKVPDSANPFIVGGPLASSSVSVTKGWNMIGAVDHTVPAPSGGIVTGAMFGYSSGGYSPEPNLVPGHAYWVRTTADGILSLGPATGRGQKTVSLDKYSQLTIRDNAGRKQTLYLIENRDGQSIIESFGMPPSPPEGAFDVRFAGGTMLEAYPQNLLHDFVCTLNINGAVDPVTVSYSIRNSDGKAVFFDESDGDKVLASHPLKGDGSMIVGSSPDKKYSIRVTASGLRPVAFALRQNYPNPFNPSTAITFDVPQKSPVSLKVYDLVGREVLTVAEGVYEQGSYTVHADLSGMSSGIYLYRLIAGQFSDVKKMLVVK